MRKEIERCHLAFQLAPEGKLVSIVSSGDSGVYGMAAQMFTLLPDYPDTELAVIPGITAAMSVAAILGAPINHDFAVISLSDLLTPMGSDQEASACRCARRFRSCVLQPCQP